MELHYTCGACSQPYLFMEPHRTCDACSQPWLLACRTTTYLRYLFTALAVGLQNHNICEIPFHSLGCWLAESNQYYSRCLFTTLAVGLRNPNIICSLRYLFTNLAVCLENLLAYRTTTYWQYLFTILAVGLQNHNILEIPVHSLWLLAYRITIYLKCLFSLGCWHIEP